ncbi:MAG: methylated-DNA--[protein]-cysteine S-methyltransferase [Planctomycetaceae bacterium]
MSLTKPSARRTVVSTERAVNSLLETAQLRDSPFGWFAVAGVPCGVCAVTFAHPTQFAAFTALRLVLEGAPEIAMKEHLGNQQGVGVRSGMSISSQRTAIDHAMTILERYFAGEPVDLGSVPLALPSTTEFRQRVRDELRAVPYGETLSYAALAERAGRPGAARAVGTVMSTNPVPLLIPCHRVLGAGNRLGGYSAPQGVEMKSRLLALEASASK